MTTKYKLTYFDLPGRAEPIRYIFAYANQEYEDVRVKPAEWQFIRPLTPFEKLPILEVNGSVFSQSTAIARYLANQFGLTGKNELESFKCDELVDTLGDLMVVIYTMHYEDDVAKREKSKKQIAEKDVPLYFQKFEKIIAENPSRLLIGDQVTWADLTFAASLGILEQGNPNILKPYPALDGLVKKIHNISSIKAWLKRRPSDLASPIIY